MYGMDERRWTEWKRKRRNTLIGFVMVGTVVGIDCSVVFSTLFLYLRDIVKTERPNMWYGIIVAAFFLSSASFGAVSGRWLDRTRKVRFYVNFAIIVQIIGFFIYLIPYHPAILMIGRAVCGIGEPFTSVVAGEVFRTYDKVGSTHAMLWLASIYSLGFIIGPALNFLFTNIHFYIGPLLINKLNFIGVFMVIFLFLVLLLANLLVHNCSQEFDLKEYLNAVNSTEKSNDFTVNTDGKNDGEKEKNDKYNSSKELSFKDGESLGEYVVPVKTVLKCLLSNSSTLLLFITTLIFVYIIFTCTALFPLIVTEILKWDLTWLSAAYGYYGIVDLFFLVFLGKYCNTTKRIYIFCIVAVISQFIGLFVIIAFKRLARNIVRDIIMVGVTTTASTLGWCFDDAMIRVLLARLIPSSIQSFGETLRAGTSKTAIIAGSFTVTTLLGWMDWWAVGMLVLITLNLAWFLLRWKQYVYPEEITFNEYIPICNTELKFENTKLKIEP